MFQQISSPANDSGGSAVARWLLGAFGVCLLLAWLNPNHYLPWLSFYSEVPAVVAGSLAVILGATAVAARPLGIGCSIALVGIAGLPWLQWLAGLFPYQGDALLASLYLAGTALCFWVGAASEVHGKRLTLCVAWSMLVAAVVSTGIALYQWFGLTGLEIWAVEGIAGERAGGNLAQANQLATLLLGGLAAVAMLRGRQTLSPWGALGIAAYLIVGLALTQSRTPWLTLAVLGAWITLRRRTLELWLPAVPMGLLVAFYALMFWAVATLPEALSLHPPAQSSRLDPGLRPLLWRQAALAIEHSPWFGYGWGQGFAAQSEAALLGPSPERYSSYAHNLVLDLAIWNGVPLALLFTTVLFGWFALAARRVQGDLQSFRFAVLTALGGHAMLEFPYAYAYFLIPLALLAGQLHRGIVAAPRSPRAAKATGLVLLAAAIVLLGCGLVMRDYLLVESDRRHLQMRMARVGAGTLQPAPQLWVLDQMEASARIARRQAVPGMPAADIDALKEISRRFPGQYFLRQLVLALALNGRTEEASVELQRLRAIHGVQAQHAVRVELQELADSRYPTLQAFVLTLQQ